MDANLHEVGSEQLAKVIAEKGIQWSTEMTYPVHFYHTFQLDLIFWRIVRKVIETDLSNGIQGSQFGITDPLRWVGADLRGE